MMKLNFRMRWLLIAGLTAGGVGVASNLALANGACCKPNGICIVESSTECAADDGIFQGESVDCDPGSWPCVASWSQPTTGPKLNLLLPRPYQVFDGGNGNGFDTGEAEYVAEQYDMIQAYRPDEVDDVREHNPDIISIYSMTFGGVPDFDYDEDPDDWNNNPDAWWVPDTLWSPVRLVQYAYWKNYYEYGVDLAYKTADEEYILHWNTRMCNWTSYCPTGTWAWTEGLTFAEICLEVFERLLESDEFRDHWDGLHFDTAPPACCYSEDYIGLEYDGIPNLPGTDDYCYGDPCFTEPFPPFVQEERATSEWFFSNLLAYTKPRLIPVIIGQDGIKTDSRPDFSGWKIERWMTQGIPQNPWQDRWEDYWYGPQLNIPGYFEAEQVLEPAADSLGGWDWSLVDANVWLGWNEADKHRFARFGLGTAALGDGYFDTLVDGASTPDGRERFYIIDEMLAEGGWAWKLPAVTDAYQVGDHQWRREFLRLNDEPCIVVVDIDTTLASSDAQLYGFGACTASEGCCYLAYEIDCVDGGGTYLGDASTCSPWSGNPVVSGGGRIHSEGATKTVHAGETPVVGRKAGLGGWEERGFLKFDTNGVVPAYATVDSVRFLLDVASATSTVGSAPRKLDRI